MEKFLFHIVPDTIANVQDEAANKLVGILIKAHFLLIDGSCCEIAKAMVMVQDESDSSKVISNS